MEGDTYEYVPPLLWRVVFVGVFWVVLWLATVTDDATTGALITTSSFYATFGLWVLVLPQRVRADDDSIEVRNLFEPETIPWSRVAVIEEERTWYVGRRLVLHRSLGGKLVIRALDWFPFFGARRRREAVLAELQRRLAQARGA